MSDLLKSNIISFIAGVVLAYVYSTNSLSELKNIYLYGLAASVSLTIIAMLIAAKKTQKQNISYNENLKKFNQNVKNLKEETIFKIIKKRLSIIPVFLLVFGSWVSSCYLCYLLAESLFPSDY